MDASESTTAAVSGLRGDYFSLDGEISDFPTLPSTTQPSVSKTDATIDFYRDSNDTNGFAGTNFREQFFVRWTGRLRIDRDGKYTFHLNSDDGSRLFLNRRLVIDNGGRHGMVEKSGTIELAAGEHDLLVELFNSGGQAGCRLFWSADGINKQLVPEHLLTHSQPMLSSNVIATTFTNEQGEFEFKHFRLGRYQVRIHTMDGFVYYQTGLPFQFAPGKAAPAINFKIQPFKKGTWRHYTVADGLPHTFVFRGSVDSNGALWFGTDGGVSRFDGRDFVNLTRRDGLPSNEVFNEPIEAEGKLWFGTHGGLTVYVDP